MTDATAPAQPADPTITADKPVDDWKPEPRQWTWKDLFTAPMLAFKPKCMLISALTLATIALWFWLYDQCEFTKYEYWQQQALMFAWRTVALTIFSLGASLVAVFLKADLLDDEFLTFGEALGQYRQRILPALLVPLFLMGMLGGVNLVLVYLPSLVATIPYAGPTLYALLYPLGFLFSLFTVLFGIAIWLSVFVFPSIIAIRKHGWFDNVVDTIEAVGTKPHLLAASLALSLVMMFFAFRIGIAGIDHLKGQARLMSTDISGALIATEARAGDFGANDMLHRFDDLLVKKVDSVNLRSTFANYDLWGNRPVYYFSDKNPYYNYGTGPVTGVWQCLIQALIIGYIGNLFIASGMLTYLVVREDDYWDDEDLEDLDKLAKELEEEAKRDQAQAPTASVTPPVAASSAPAAAAVPPVAPPTTPA